MGNTLLSRFKLGESLKHKLRDVLVAGILTTAGVGGVIGAEPVYKIGLRAADLPVAYVYTAYYLFLAGLVLYNTSRVYLEYRKC